MSLATEVANLGKKLSEQIGVVKGQFSKWDGQVKAQIKKLEDWKNNLRGRDLAIDYIFTKKLEPNIKLDGHVLWNVNDKDADDKSSYIILFDGANNEEKKYSDGSISAGLYLGEILFSTAGRGGGVYSGKIGFIYQHSGHTNNSLLEELPIVRASHAFNGAEVKVFARSLSTGNEYHQENQILFYLNEGDRETTDEIEITLILKKLI